MQQRSFVRMSVRMQSIQDTLGADRSCVCAFLSWTPRRIAAMTPTPVSSSSSDSLSAGGWGAACCGDWLPSMEAGGGGRGLLLCEGGIGGLQTGDGGILLLSGVG